MELDKTSPASLLDDLCVAYQGKGMNVGSSLQPPLSADQARQHLEAAKLPANPGIVALYGWHNGSTEESGAPLTFVGKVFVSLDRALTERHLMLTSLGRDGEDGVESMLFPFALGDGAWYAVEIDNDASPVYTVGEVAEIHFESLEAMLKTCVEWVLEPDWALNQPPARAQEIWYKHNPTVDE